MEVSFGRKMAAQPGLRSMMTATFVKDPSTTRVYLRTQRMTSKGLGVSVSQENDVLRWV